MLFFAFLTYSVLIFFFITQFFLTLNQLLFTVIILIIIMLYLVLQIKNILQSVALQNVVSLNKLYKDLYHKRLLLFAILNYNIYIFSLLRKELIKDFSYIYILFPAGAVLLTKKRNFKELFKISDLGLRSFLFVKNSGTIEQDNFLNLSSGVPFLISINLILFLWFIVCNKN